MHANCASHQIPATSHSDFDRGGGDASDMTSWPAVCLYVSWSVRVGWRCLALLIRAGAAALCARSRGEPSSAHCEQRLSERLTPCPCEPVCACRFNSWLLHALPLEAGGRATTSARSRRSPATRFQRQRVKKPFKTQAHTGAERSSVSPNQQSEATPPNPDRPTTRQTNR